ncbi:hypothetical protein LCGC14_2496890 [marine sediment metagenome]|uniref:Uncharacterized protein n=1 Tax=marine sediment metagenome TaxID=412755 RepID=A0A0F9BR26_9ZZZZ
MITRYQKEHYEDVARVLSYHTTAAGMDDEQERMQWLTWIAKSFIDLFAADNPRRCTAHVACPYHHSDGRDNDCHIYGFNRERFLEACGLESEG